jgi:hypothetical protein
MEARRLEALKNYARQHLVGERRRQVEMAVLEACRAVGGVKFSHSGGSPDKGHSAAARELGVDRARVIQTEKIETQAIPEAKEAAREAGITDTDPAMLMVAKAPPAQQVETVQD